MLFVVISHLHASVSVDCIATACWAEDRQARAKYVEQECKSWWRKFSNGLFLSFFFSFPCIINGKWETVSHSFSFIFSGLSFNWTHLGVWKRKSDYSLFHFMWQTSADPLIAVGSFPPSRVQTFLFGNNGENYTYIDLILIWLPQDCAVEESFIQYLQQFPKHAEYTAEL